MGEIYIFILLSSLFLASSIHAQKNYWEIKYSGFVKVDNIIKVSPRMIYKIGKTKFATEFEYTASAYGTDDDYLKVSDTKSIYNLRILLSAIYSF